MGNNIAKKIAAIFFITLILFIGVFAFTVPEIAHAAEREECMPGWMTINVGACSRLGIAWVLYIIIMGVAMLTKFAGFLLDLSFDYSVVNMSKNISSMTEIGTAWKVLRDFANIGFIFFLLFVAIQTILQVGNANIKKTLVNIIIAALFINFSIFITKAIIDVSNITTLAFFDRLALDGSIAARFMQVLRLSSTPPGDGAVYDWAESASTLVLMPVGTLIILFFATFSFLAIAFMMMIRYVILIMLIILSPLAFAAQGLPQLKDLANKWWNALLSQALFPIIYVLVMLVGVILLSGGTLSVAGGNLGDTVQNVKQASDKGAADLMLKYFLAIVIMNMALIMSKQYAMKVGGLGASAMKWGTGKIDKFQNTTGRAAYSATAGAAVRGTVGRGAAAINDKIGDTAWGNSRTGRWINSAFGNVAKQKFGTGVSSVDIQKANKKAQEDYAKKVDKELQKKTDEIAYGKDGGENMMKERRQKSIDTTRSDIAALEARIAMTTDQKERERLETKKKGLEKRHEDLQTLMEEGSDATKEERNEILKELREKRMEELKAENDRPGIVGKVGKKLNEVEWINKRKNAIEEKLTKAGEWMDDHKLGSVKRAAKATTKYLKETYKGGRSQDMRKAAIDKLRADTKKGKSMEDTLKDLLKEGEGEKEAPAKEAKE